MGLRVDLKEGWAALLKRVSDLEDFAKKIQSLDPSHFEDIGEVRRLFEAVDPLQNRSVLNWVNDHYGPIRFTAKMQDKIYDTLDDESTETFLRSGQIKGRINAYLESFQTILDSIAPEKFTYEGFQIHNPEHFSDSSVRVLLDAVDYIQHVFKRRGALKLLQKTIRKFILRHRDTGEGDGSDVAGYYHPEGQYIILLWEGIGDTSPGRFMKAWVYEVLLHELGHHIHMFLLHPEAKAVWDEAWEPVDAAKGRAKERRESPHGVTARDRQRFFEMLQASKWDFQGVGRKLKGLDRAKYLAWLHKPSEDTPSIQLSSTPNQVRPTEFAQEMATLFVQGKEGLDKWVWNDPSWTPEERQIRLERTQAQRQRIYRAHLGLRDDRTHPWLSTVTQAPLIESDPEVAEAFEMLDAPSDYAKTNVKEDFAETFAAFIGNPSKLSERAMFRMQQALSRSALFGTPILKLGARQKKACIIATGKWGGHLCLLKNRDRNYTPKIKIVHEVVDGVEVAYFWDTTTDWSEGMNEHGIAIVNSALQVKADEAEHRNTKNGKKSKDGERIRKALSCSRIEDAIKSVCEYKGGVKGHTFITDGAKVWSVEQTSKHECVVTEIDSGLLHIRTNHGYHHEDAGYGEGPNQLSSLIRRETAERVLSTVKSPEKIGPALMNARKEDRTHPNNMVRDTDNMKTSSQLIMNPARRRMWVYVIPGQAEFVTVDNRLPRGRTPCIRVHVYEYEGLEKKKVGLTKVSAQRVVRAFLGNM